jgi:hypothetical protein
MIERLAKFPSICNGVKLPTTYLAYVPFYSSCAYTFYTRLLLLFLTLFSLLCYSLTMFVPIDNDRSHVYQGVLLLLSLFVQELLAYAMYDQGMHVTVLTS